VRYCKYGFNRSASPDSELWFDQAPTGLLEVCAELGRDDYKNCIVFHSLLQHGFHRSTLRLKQAGVVLALQRRDRCGIANMASHYKNLMPVFITG
jgi:hypothetical protein